MTRDANAETTPSRMSTSANKGRAMNLAATSERLKSLRRSHKLRTDVAAVVTEQAKRVGLRVVRILVLSEQFETWAAVVSPLNAIAEPMTKRLMLPGPRKAPTAARRGISRILLHSLTRHSGLVHRIVLKSQIPSPVARVQVNRPVSHRAMDEEY